MINWIRLDYRPGTLEWISASNAPRLLLAVAEAESPEVRVYDAASGGGEVLRTVRVHSAPVLLMKLNVRYGAVVSVDAKGVFFAHPPISPICRTPTFPISHILILFFLVSPTHSFLPYVAPHFAHISHFNLL